MMNAKVAPFVAAAAAYAGKTKKRGGKEFWGCFLCRRDLSSSLSLSSSCRRRFYNHRRVVNSTGASSSSRDDSDDKNVFDAFSQMKTKKKKKELSSEADDEETKTSNWRPAPPDISSSAPREFSPISYALLGDSVWELFVRSYLFAPRSKPSTYDSKVKKLARAESQAYAYRKINDDDDDDGAIRLTDEELDVCKWGRNADYSNVPKRLRGKKSQGGGHDIYRQASALEVILGWWMVTDDERLDEVLERVKTSGWLEDALTSVEYGSEEEED
jgi:ribonuclease-3 family protein